MIIWTWLVGRVGQIAASAIGIGLLMALITGAVTLVGSWIKSANDAAWLRSINQATEQAAARSSKAAQAEREKAEADKAAALDRVRDLENELQAMKDDPVCFPKSIARSLNR
jgi:hypothetical protein